MKNKKTLLFSSIAVIVIIIGFVLYNQWITTTYGEVLNEVISQDEEISVINVTLKNINVGEEDEEFKIRDEADISDFVNFTSDMELKRKDEYEGSLHFLTIATNYDIYSVAIDKNENMYIDGTYYKVSGKNKVIEFINTFKEKS